MPDNPSNVQYRIGSITKTFTAALVMRLRDQGVLDLDRPLTEYAPGLPTANATLRDVLAHVAGLRENPDGPWWELGFTRNAAELFSRGASSLGTLRAIRGVHHYSNLGYALIGWILERITGQEWERLLHEQLLRALALDRTSTTPSEPHAIGHVVHPWHDTATAVPLSKTGGMAPAGQLWSSVDDLLRWGRCLLGEHEGVLSARSAQEMRRPLAMADEGWREGQGAGLQLWRDDQAIYAGHGGSVPGFCAALLIDPANGHVVAVCTNGARMADSDPVSVGRKALRHAAAEWSPDRRPWRAAGSPPSHAVNLTGRWWAITSEYEVTWDHQAAALAMTTVDDRTLVSHFTREAEDSWCGLAGPAMGESLHIERDNNGHPMSLRLGGISFQRAPYTDL